MEVLQVSIFLGLNITNYIILYVELIFWIKFNVELYHAFIENMLKHSSK